MSVLDETKLILKKYKIEANKSLGQNFLISEEAVNAIIDSSNIENNELVIEIGPGLGVLTSILLKKAYKVIAIELDSKMVKIISDRFKEYNNLEIINMDVLKVDLKEIINEEITKSEKEGSKINKVKVVANLPYYISTPIIMKLLEERLNINSIVVMVQKEVADRLADIPGGKMSGAITYEVNYYSKASKIITVGKECFIPSPKVESEVIKMEIRDEVSVKVENEKLFFNLIRNVFSQRRKTLVNVLVNYKMVDSKDVAVNIIKEMGLSQNLRGECLSMEQFKTLSDYLIKEYNKKNK